MKAPVIIFAAATLFLTLSAMWLGSVPAPDADAGGPTVTLSPATATNPVGSDHTVTATVGNSLPDTPVEFSITAGPNTGATGTCNPANCQTTALSNDVTFTYTGAVGVGDDTIQACVFGTCDTATKTWVAGSPSPSTSPTATAAAATGTATAAAGTAAPTVTAQVATVTPAAVPGTGGEPNSGPSLLLLLAIGAGVVAGTAGLAGIAVTRRS